MKHLRPIGQVKVQQYIGFGHVPVELELAVWIADMDSNQSDPLINRVKNINKTWNYWVGLGWQVRSGIATHSCMNWKSENHNHLAGWNALILISSSTIWYKKLTPITWTQNNVRFNHLILISSNNTYIQQRVILLKPFMHGPGTTDPLIRCFPNP